MTATSGLPRFSASHAVDKKYSSSTIFVIPVPHSRRGRPVADFRRASDRQISAEISVAAYSNKVGGDGRLALHPYRNGKVFRTQKCWVKKFRLITRARIT